LISCRDGGTCLPVGRLVDDWNYLMYFVYAIKSNSRNYVYVGLTNDLTRRIAEHNDGQNKTTKPYRPFKIIYTESFNTRVEARVKEKYLKSGVGKEFLKKSN